jgi:hypothetical protein
VKHKIIRLIVILLILGAVGGGYWYFRQHLINCPASKPAATGQTGTTDAPVSGFIEAEELPGRGTQGRIAASP